MGPRHFCRGISAWPSNRRAPYSSFNGATAFLPWNQFLHGDHLAGDHELQWGHGISAVESISNHRILMSLGPLQWGHGISAVESRHLEIADIQHPRASMGPRHFCRGILQHREGARRRALASMGPRHFCRGIPRSSGSRGSGQHGLQWGHGISAVESTVAPATR